MKNKDWMFINVLPSNKNAAMKLLKAAGLKRLWSDNCRWLSQAWGSDAFYPQRAIL